MVAAITFTDLLEDVPRTLPEPPFDFRRAPRHCKFPTPTPLALPVTKSIRAIHRTLLTAVCPASLQKSHVSARHLLSVCGLSLRALTGASSTGPLNFAMYPERAVGLIFIPFSRQQMSQHGQ